MHVRVGEACDLVLVSWILGVGVRLPTSSEVAPPHTIYSVKLIITPPMFLIDLVQLNSTQLHSGLIFNIDEAPLSLSFPI